VVKTLISSLKINVSTSRNEAANCVARPCIDR
jgi:hypothetical protein